MTIGFRVTVLVAVLMAFGPVLAQSGDGGGGRKGNGRGCAEGPITIELIAGSETAWAKSPEQVVALPHSSVIGAGGQQGLRQIPLASLIPFGWPDVKGIEISDCAGKTQRLAGQHVVQRPDMYMISITPRGFLKLVRNSADQRGPGGGQVVARDIRRITLTE